MRVFPLFLAVALYPAAVVAAAPAKASKSNKAVVQQPAASLILIVGDGNGLSAQQLLRLVDGPLAVDAMQDSAVVLTASQNDSVTDSAAGATAMATGTKTKNGAVGVDAAGKPVRNVAELAQQAGKKVGVMTTSLLWDATPAAFLAHVPKRKDYEAITRQALQAKPDLLMGGGEAWLIPEDMTGTFGEGEREDGADVLRQFEKAGYTVGNDLNIPRLPYLGLLARETMYSEDPPQYNPRFSLADMTRAALAALSKEPQGFFLVIEDEGIDEMAHANALEPMLDALRGWDQAVAVALAYQKAHPGTVVLVTSDHETGNIDITGLLECPGRSMLKGKLGRFCADFSTRGHGGMPVAVYATGMEIPGAVIENTAIFDLIKQGLALP